VVVVLAPLPPLDPLWRIFGSWIAHTPASSTSPAITIIFSRRAFASAREAARRRCVAVAAIYPVVDVSVVVVGVAGATGAGVETNALSVTVAVITLPEVCGPAPPAVNWISSIE